MSLLQSLSRVKNEIESACAASGRSSGSVRLMLVTKTHPMERILEAYKIGHRLFGENKIQEVAQKWAASAVDGLRPEFIGHLQTNKVKACLNACGRIHSLDRMSLVEALDHELQKRGEQREVFLQVNTSGESSKYGVAVENALGFAEAVSRYPTLKVTGLMTLALFSHDQGKVRPCFRRLKELFLRMRERDLFGEGFRHLSMGMSSDYVIAIEEGATIVRVGTAILGARPTPDSYYWPENEKK